ncbi:Scopoletin 8-hydroxylase [Stylosanthes scabra]|uniref:Scopoletin 8-hydroxylase n=1 Tax=Stylosanthes scabra TaxID=79078 RepID=A0ABU6VSK4_9FABA|nr:Scopoletin 8-hydroxylase [Stylosanthes scabra]
MAQSFGNSDSLYDFVVKDGNGVKGLMDLGLSEVPERYIQPEEERIKKVGARRHNVAPIDLSKLKDPDHKKVVDEIVRAAETLGFFQVVNHGVPFELLESLKDSAHKFFNLSPEEKCLFCPGVSPSSKVKYGTSFVPEKEKALEWKDYISMGYTTDEDALQYWPDQCKEVAIDYLKLSSKIVREIVEILIENVGMKLEESRIEAIIEMKMVNMNYYPVCPNPDLTVGVGRHSDMGTMTVLLQDGIGGLYVKLDEDNNNNDGEWAEIPPIHGSLVINIGDIIEIMSNGKYKIAEHRVRTTSSESRVSIPVTAPKPTEKIGPLEELVKKDGVARYKQFMFEDYINNHFANAHHGKKSLDFAKSSP